MNIDTMPSGREMDALVAEKVMGWKVVGPTTRADFLTDNEPLWQPDPLGRWCPVPRFSTSISAAWEVVEKIGANGIGCKISNYAPGWRAEFYKNDGDAGGDTAPLAISRAALKSAGEGKGK